MTISIFDMETKSRLSHAFEHMHCLSWIGQDYLTGDVFGKKLFVLGESHYCAEGDFSSSTVTTDVIRYYLQAGDFVPPEYQSYKKIDCSLTGTMIDSAMHNRVWRSVVFFNYLQLALSELRWRFLHCSSCSKHTAPTTSSCGVTAFGNICRTIVGNGRPCLNGCYRLTDVPVKTILVYSPSTGYA